MFHVKNYLNGISLILLDGSYLKRNFFLIFCEKQLSGVVHEWWIFTKKSSQLRNYLNKNFDGAGVFASDFCSVSRHFISTAMYICSRLSVQICSLLQLIIILILFCTFPGRVRIGFCNYSSKSYTIFV